MPSPSTAACSSMIWYARVSSSSRTRSWISSNEGNLLRGVAVDGATGACWALGERDVAVFSATGALEAHWTDVPGGSGLFFDPVHSRAWIGIGNALVKFTPEGQTIARLDGFSSIIRIAVDPGR